MIPSIPSGGRSNRRRLPFWFAVLASVSVAGCFGPSGSENDLADARNRWNSTPHETYSYDFRRSCFCAPPSLVPARIFVVGSTIDRVEKIADGTTMTPQEIADLAPLTVEELFETIERALDRDFAKVNVTYDARSGVPTYIDLDGSLSVADDEISYTIENVELPVEPGQAVPRARGTSTHIHACAGRRVALGESVVVNAGPGGVDWRLVLPGSDEQHEAPTSGEEPLGRFEETSEDT